MDGSLHTELKQQAGAGDQAEQPLVRHRPRKAAKHDKGIKRQQRQAGQRAEFLAGHGEDEIRMRVGKMVLNRPVTRADTEQAAIGKGIAGLLDLPGPTFPELVDPLVNMAKGEIGGHQPQRCQRDDTDDKQHRHAGKEHLEAPGQHHHQGHADIRLQNKNADDHRHQSG